MTQNIILKNYNEKITLETWIEIRGQFKLDFVETKCEDVTELNWLNNVQLRTQE